MELKIQMASQLVLPGLVRSVKFSGDGRYLATGTRNNARIFDVKNGSAIW
jgi:WD40 repeat protein